jgi:ribose 1,5-bisphosphokinase PhnN
MNEISKPVRGKSWRDVLPVHRKLHPILLDVLAQRLQLVGRHQREQIGGRMISWAVHVAI